MASLHPLDEFKGARTHGFQVVGVGEVVRTLPVRFFQDVAVPRSDPVVRIHKLRVRLVEVEHNGVFVRGLDGFDGGDQTPSRNVHELICHLHDTEFHILRGHRGPIVELRSWIEVEGVGQRVS